jgi:hypothetical protein
MADEAIQLFRGGERPAPRNIDTGDTSREGRERVEQVMFDRKELGTILSVYGRKVAEGEWRDYAIGAGREAAVFAVFQRTSEMPLYRIEKRPKLRRAQGLYSLKRKGPRNGALCCCAVALCVYSRSPISESRNWNIAMNEM